MRRRSWWKTHHGEELEQSREALPKNLIRLLLVQDPKGIGFRRPALSFVDARAVLGMRKAMVVAQKREEAKP
jgi:hypothetical protein